MSHYTQRFSSPRAWLECISIQISYVDGIVSMSSVYIYPLLYLEDSMLICDTQKDYKDI